MYFLSMNNCRKCGLFEKKIIKDYGVLGEENLYMTAKGRRVSHLSAASLSRENPYINTKTS